MRRTLSQNWLSPGKRRATWLGWKVVPCPWVPRGRTQLWGWESQNRGAGYHGAGGPCHISSHRFPLGSSPIAPSQSNEHRATLLFSSFLSFLAVSIGLLPLEVVGLCSTCIPQLFCKVDDLFVFLSHLLNGLLLHWVEVFYFIFLIQHIYILQCKKLQLIRNVWSRKLNMSILATPPSLLRLPSVKRLDLGSDLIKVSHLLILFTPFFWRHHMACGI